MATLTEDVVLSRSRAKSLSAVKKLNCWGSGLSDDRELYQTPAKITPKMQTADQISVLRKMPNVEVVTLSVNEISSLKDFAYCPKLKELYLRRNGVVNLEEIQYLKNLPFLKVLWLSDNPCSESQLYRSTVLKNLPNVKRLDNVEVNAIEVEEAVTSGKEYLVPDGIPVYTDISTKDNLNGNSLELGLSNGIVDTGKHQNVESSGNDLLDETNKLRTQLGLKPLMIEENTVDEKSASEKIPSSSTENDLSTSKKKSSVLSAVLLLLNDMEENDLRVVQQEIDRKLETVQDDNVDGLERDKDVLT